MSPDTLQQALKSFTNAGKRVTVKTIALRGAKQPRLRFDRTAVGLVRRLQAALAKSVPDGKTVVVTITAPIRQDSKTGLVLEDEIRRLLGSRRPRLKAQIHGNRIEVRVLKGGASRTSRLIAFVHNPKPSSTALFAVTRSVLAWIDSAERRRRGDRCLIVTNRDGLAPVETIRHVCSALRARTVFKRILLAEGNGLRAL